ncbi:hypothetical protein [Chryseobacterium vrystaatense]|uniref:TIGR03066 family protein n=1 Tax=Chryseobacterium vrystaatense TaxID=307480 RepID=A0A1M5JDA3_9FLAO|nr:hypothetical protein [Chryseobacterium vrystaatense]KFF25365.1 hypothetical protein IW16_15270 [Chryseobacterium vrystaatense]SHG38576.1 TIGR03066 family protein [Chryseobacterium vrystaatense]
MKQILIILGCFLALSCNSQKKKDARLIGKWDGSLKDLKTGSSMEKIVLEFTKDGKFLQHMGEGKMQNTIESSFEIQNDKIISVDKGTTEKNECTYTIKDDTLTILYEGIENKYIKTK